MPDNSSDSQENNTNLQEQYYSSKILMAIAQKEYDIENDRKKNLDTRTGVFISFTSALLLFLAQNIMQLTIWSEKFTSIQQTVMIVFYIVSLLFLFSSLSVSLYFYIKVISTTQYQRLNISNFLEATKKPENIFAQALTRVYNDNITYNRKQNDLKIEYFQKGIFSMKISLVSLIFMYTLVIISKI